MSLTESKGLSSLLEEATMSADDAEQREERYQEKVVELKAKPDYSLGIYKDKMQSLLDQQRQRHLNQTAQHEATLAEVDEQYRHQEEDIKRRADELDKEARKMRELYAATVANHESAMSRMRQEHEALDIAQRRIIRSHEAMLEVLREGD